MLQFIKRLFKLDEPPVKAEPAAPAPAQQNLNPPVPAPFTFRSETPPDGFCNITRPVILAQGFQFYIRQDSFFENFSSMSNLAELGVTWEHRTQLLNYLASRHDEMAQDIFKMRKLLEKDLSDLLSADTLPYGEFFFRKYFLSQDYNLAELLSVISILTADFDVKVSHYVMDRYLFIVHSVNSMGAYTRFVC